MRKKKFMSIQCRPPRKRNGDPASFSTSKFFRKLVNDGLILLLLFCFSSVASYAWEEEYQRKTILIPWGDGVGHLPAVLETGTYEGKPYSEYRSVGTGSDFFRVDDKGDFYVLYQFPLNKTEERRGIKCFDSSGQEIGSWEPAISKYQGFRFISLSGNKVYLVDDLDNKIVELGDDLKFLNEISIPKSFNPPWGLTGTFVGAGLVHSYYSWDPTDTKGRLVFDNEEWEKNGKPNFVDAPRRRIKVVAHWADGHVPSNSVIINVYQIKNGKWKENLLFSLNEDVNVAGSENDNSKRLDHTQILGVDGQGNFYIHLLIQASKFQGLNFVERIIKVNSEGTVLYRLENPWTASKVTPYQVDKLGKIYNCGSGPDGFQVNVWKKIDK